MQTVGEFLKEKREGRALTLEQVAIESRVSLRMLEALEENKLDKIPSEVFARGFIRLYAHYLQMNPDEVFEMFSESISSGFKRSESGWSSTRASSCSSSSILRRSPLRCERRTLFFRAVRSMRRASGW